MSVQAEITRLSEAKAAIRSSIQNKGVEVPASTSISGMAAYIDLIPSGGAGDTESLQANFIDVPVSSWVASSEVEGYPYEANIEITGCTSNHQPFVVYDKATAESGNLANEADSYDGGVKIYAKTPVVITISSIICIHQVDYVAPIRYKVTTNINDSELGSVSGAGLYEPDSQVTLVATAKGYGTFDGWYNGSTKVSSSASYTFTVTGNITLEARFNERARNITVTGTGNSTRCYVAENSASGTKHSSAGTFTLTKGSTLYCYAKAYSNSYSSYVYVNGKVVASHSKSTTQTTYNYTANKDCTVTLSYSNSKDATITITEV